MRVKVTGVDSQASFGFLSLDSEPNHTSRSWRFYFEKHVNIKEDHTETIKAVVGITP